MELLLIILDIFNDFDSSSSIGVFKNLRNEFFILDNYLVQYELEFELKIPTTSRKIYDAKNAGGRYWI